MWSAVSDNHILLIGIIVCLCLFSFLSLNQKQRHEVLIRLRLRRRRSSSTGTPPRSLSPTESRKIKDLPSNSLPEKNEYISSFPESRRNVLEDLAAGLSSSERLKLGDLSFDETTFTQNLLSWEEDYRKADKSKYSFVGFSVQEIKALGDFPDYAALSGVPLPDAYKEFDIDKAKPRPYRPFRWAYHQTMSLTKLEPDWWLELEDTYRQRITQRKSLYAHHGEAVLQWLPGSELACKELMEMALQFLCARYPHYFTLSSSDADAKKTVFANKVLGTTQIVQDKHPLLVLLDNIPEDFALMLRNPDTGYYHFRAGMICSALGWNVATKIGKRLHEIHAPIPDYKEKMQFSMDR